MATKIKYTSFKYIAEIVVWCDEALENFGFALKGANAPENLQFKSCETAKTEARKLVKRLKKEALELGLDAIQGSNITSDYLVEPETIETNVKAETNEVHVMTTIQGWEYINSQASYENRRNENYVIFSKLSTAAYNGEFEGVYFEKIYNWIDQMTATELDVFVTEFKDLDSTKHYVVFADHAMKLYQSREIEPDTIIPSVNVETIEVITPSVNPSDNLNTLEISTSENLETLENPQGSTHELDKFEVTYQVAESEYEVSYESRTVYANSKNHAKSIVIQSLQAQNLRFCITGCEYALLIDDLSDFSLVDEF